MSNMKITIATPTFGKPRYLKECIDSICHQSLTTFHIVCGGNLLFQEETAGKNVEIINQTPDPGMVVCWSTAASLAKTEYIGFLADDNSLQPDFAERMVDFLENHPECDLVFCNQHHMDSEGKIDIEKSKAFTKYFGRDVLPEGIIDESYYSVMLDKGAIPLEACVIRKKVWDIFGPFKTQAKGSFDHEFVYRILLSKVKVAFIPDYLMNFRVHDGAYSSRERKEHLIGSIWTYETLMHSNQEYYHICKTKNIAFKGRLLRYKIPLQDRIKLMKTLVPEKDGLKHIIKNSIVRILNKAKLRKN